MPSAEIFGLQAWYEKVPRCKELAESMNISLMPLAPYDRCATYNSKTCTAVLELRQKNWFCLPLYTQTPENLHGGNAVAWFPGRARTIRLKISRINPKQIAAPFADNHFGNHFKRDRFLYDIANLAVSGIYPPLLAAYENETLFISILLFNLAFSFPISISAVLLLSSGLNNMSRLSSGEISIIRHWRISLSSIVSYIAWLTSVILKYDDRSLSCSLKKLLNHSTSFHWSKICIRRFPRFRYILLPIICRLQLYHQKSYQKNLLQIFI